MVCCRQVIRSWAEKDHSYSLANVTKINANVEKFDDYSQEVVINEKSLGLFDLKEIVFSKAATRGLGLDCLSIKRLDFESMLSYRQGCQDYLKN